MSTPVTTPTSTGADTKMTTANPITTSDESTKVNFADMIDTVYDAVVKSSEDKRNYRGLLLKNGLKVMLIQDATTEKASAAMDVHVGNMADPDTIPGMAHLCEHMLFLGTEKYPSENDYCQFLSEHAGGSNAFTGTEHTNYYFDVGYENIREALDKFSQFFKCPLFNADAMEREINAVTSENDKNLKSDSWRLFQLEKATSAPGHPFNRFGTGNKYTLQTKPEELGIDVREELLKFHNQYYSSNIMALCVIARESLDELVEMVCELFSPIVNKNLSIPVFDTHPHGPDQLKLIAKVVPVRDIRSLHLSFPLQDLSEYYKSNPGHYVAHLIGHEGPGSLLSELKSTGWVNALSGGHKEGAKGFMFFIIHMQLTEDGMGHIDEIIGHTFQYLNMMKEIGPQEWIYNECQHLNSMSFRFKDKERPRGYSSKVAALLHEFPIEETIEGPYLMCEFTPDLINMILNQLRPELIRVAVIAKEYESIADMKEEWYSTSYKLEKIPEQTIQMWTNVGRHERLFLPTANEFIPTDFQIYERDQNSTDFPILIRDTPLTRVWFKQDNKFFLPKASLQFEIKNPLAYMDPHHCNMSFMFLDLLKDSLNEYAYSAEIAGLDYTLHNTIYGIFLAIKGYSDKQRILLRKILDKMSNFEIDEKRFKILKQEYKRSISNFVAHQPHQHAVYYTAVLLSEHSWTKNELLAATDDMTTNELRAFIPRLLSNVHIESLVHGNVTKKQALEVSEDIETLFRTRCATKPLLPCQLIRHRQYELPDRSYYMYQCENSVHNTCGVEVYYQCGLQSTSNNMLLELISQIIDEPCFNTLRTIEQLGYLVFSGLRRSNSVQGMRVIIQSDKSATFVEQRIEVFIESMKKFIEDMSDEDFAKQVSALATRRLDKPKTLYGEANLQWSEILSRQYNFDRDNLEVACLKKITKKELLQFYNENLAIDAVRRRKLAVHVIPTHQLKGSEQNHAVTAEVVPENGTQLSPVLPEPTVIGDVAEFKSSLPLFPLVPPYISIKLNCSMSKL